MLKPQARSLSLGLGFSRGKAKKSRKLRTSLIISFVRRLKSGKAAGAIFNLRLVIFEKKICK
jgi:hypothetical protein